MTEQWQRLDLFTLPSSFRGRKGGYVQLWWLVQSTLFAWSPQVLYGWRRFLLRLFGAKIGKGVIIRPYARITYPWKVSIGDFSWIGDDVVLYSLGDIRIGAHAVVSQRCYFCTGSHDYTRSTFDIYAKAIFVESCAWLATDVFMAPGIHIGMGAVVGARSSVFQDVPNLMVAMGSPAKPFKKRILSDNDDAATMELP